VKWQIVQALVRNLHVRVGVLVGSIHHMKACKALAMGKSRPAMERLTVMFCCVVFITHSKHRFPVWRG